MVIIDENYSAFTLEELNYEVEKGAALVEKHGIENLHNILTEEDDFAAAGAYFDYRVTTDEDNYKDEPEKD
jgi:hypothetical protein